MTNDGLPAPMELDLAALESAEAELARSERPTFDNPWDEFAWEATTLIDLVVRARDRLAGQG